MEILQIDCTALILVMHFPHKPPQILTATHKMLSQSTFASTWRMKVTYKRLRGRYRKAKTLLGRSHIDAVRHGHSVLINFAHHAGRQEKSEVMAA